MNVLETVLSFPAASVNASAATDTEVGPCPSGVNVAVYFTVVTPVNALHVPPVSVMSVSSKSVVGELDVKT